jgi:hypothetical protein
MDQFCVNDSRRLTALYELLTKLGEAREVKNSRDINSNTLQIFGVISRSYVSILCQRFDTFDFVV